MKERREEYGDEREGGVEGHAEMGSGTAGEEGPPRYGR